MTPRCLLQLARFDPFPEVIQKIRVTLNHHPAFLNIGTRIEDIVRCPDSVLLGVGKLKLYPVLFEMLKGGMLV